MNEKQILIGGVSLLSVAPFIWYYTNMNREQIFSTIFAFIMVCIVYSIPGYIEAFRSNYASDSVRQRKL